MPNHLINETSPYLLQHAHNPVDWYPWAEEALKKARTENKPILVSIGYSACHWCHVMERESFEDPNTAAIMNEGFVNIKIDREERPDLDHIFMDAVQAMTGSGGWPLNVFLTPEGKPFYGGTYFPPRAAFNRPSWSDLLKSIVSAFQDRRDEIDQQSENITSHIFQSNGFGIQELDKASAADSPFTRENMKKIYEQMMAQADRRQGGFGHAPKFPQTFIIRFLLQYYYYTKDREALDQACLSLDSMIAGGIYDQLGGGFARYSTDDQWLAPHFEKMLYDNALLVTVMSEAFQLTKKDSYRMAIVETLGFISRELLSDTGGFYSALDADSEGVEGKFYVWDQSEIESILQTDADVFCDFYGVREKGNWEGKNILHARYKPDEYAKMKGGDPSVLLETLAACRRKLFAA
ncbi:MAG TPA: thioredoxin domain-containing protein, partial [Puia sp.]|nr:thioredoxin domain-containing protein [Puia sp.]